MNAKLLKADVSGMEYNGRNGEFLFLDNEGIVNYVTRNDGTTYPVDLRAAAEWYLMEAMPVPIMDRFQII